MSDLDRISALDRRMKEIWQPIFDAQLELIHDLTSELEEMKARCNPKTFSYWLVDQLKDDRELQKKFASEMSLLDDFIEANKRLSKERDAQLETIRELTMQLEAAKSEIDMRHRTIRLLIKNIDEKNARLHELEGERQMPQPVFYDNGEVVKFSKSFSGRPWGKVTK